MVVQPSRMGSPPQSGTSHAHHSTGSSSARINSTVSESSCSSVINGESVAVPPLRPASAHYPPSDYSRRSNSLRSWSGEAPKPDSVRTLSLSLESADNLATFHVKQEQQRQGWGDP
ncbi:hypothetical protein DV517_32120 [Streptomyces sp. S816]|nr:hypothetical protein DV517_32120 [Streptomyces sp. S816]